jgi:hypothetical protein
MASCSFALHNDVAELNTNLVLERRVNRQLRETVQVDAVPQLTTSGELTREPTMVSG